MSTIHRASLGRVAQLGALYDVRTESLLRDSIFSSKLDEDDIDRLDLGDTTVELVLSDRIEEKFHKLGIEAELQVSVLSGLVKLSGSASYLNEDKKSARAASMSLVYKVRTTSEEVYIRQHPKKINVEMLKSSIGNSVNATHVVVGIDWGALCSITCEYENSENEDLTTITGALNAELYKLKGLLDVKGSATVDYEEKTKGIGNKFSFYSKCDVSSTDNNLPVSFEGALEQAKNLPSLVKKTNQGKGVPLTFTLVPLETVLKMCNLQIEIDILFQSVREDTVQLCIQAVESLTDTRQKLHDLRADLNRSKNYIPDRILTDCNKLVDGFLVAESNFKADLQDRLQSVRSQKEEISSLHELIVMSVGERFSTSKVEEEMRKYQSSLNKISEVDDTKKLGIVYVGKQDQVNFQIREHVYVLYVNEVTTEQQITLLNKSKSFFLRLHQTHRNDDNIQFYVVDLALRPDLGQENDFLIAKYINGQKVCSDVLKDEGQDIEKCLIETRFVKYAKDRPNDRALVKLRCPNAMAGSGQCSGNPLQWSCKKCKAEVWYGIQTKRFYCKCGNSNPEDALFRCSELKHGIHFIQYPKDILASELSCLRAVKDINILILGETGVGKSTWINGFANYLFFENLDDAKSSDDLMTVIPSKFTFTDNDGEIIDIKIGTDSPNEDFTAGQSATQEPVAYPFYVGEQMVRLIDTPGIGDSRGIEQDKKNFENILAHLTYYEEIHGVCILLKPNNARLTVFFRFCIQQLLAHLHKDVVRIITFCFTNTRGNFYKPGDTLPALKKALKDTGLVGFDATLQNMFCFDNEAFRFLACFRSGINFESEEIEAFSKSWDVSVKETHRLFDHIKKLRPHKILDTLTINDARRVIVELSRPIAEITVAVQKNIRSMEESKMKIDLADKEMADFTNDLYFTGVDLEHVPLDYPRTVCTHADCSETIESGKEKLPEVNYKQHCCEYCYIPGVPTETVGDFRLLVCWSMLPLGTCRRCGHSYSVHMHRTYDLETVERQFISDSVQAKIDEKKGVKAQMEAKKEALDILIKEFKDEEKKVLKISAKFGAFLKDFAIIPYNDAMGDYLDMIIEQESRKDETHRDSRLVKRLIHSRKSYEEEKRILKQAMAGTSEGKVSSPGEIKELQQELFHLKHFGQSLKDIFDQIEKSKRKTTQSYRQGEIMIPQQTGRRYAASVKEDSDKGLLGRLITFFKFS